jgi:hypothetical protein
MSDDRWLWKQARNRLSAIETERKRLLQPTQKRFRDAQEALYEIEERIGSRVATCESCDEPIFAGDLYLSGDDVDLCAKCAPTYDDLLTSPGSFLNMDEQPMTEEQARREYDEHIAAGGKPTDHYPPLLRATP